MVADEPLQVIRIAQPTAMVCPWRCLIALRAYPGRVVWCSVELLVGWWLCDSIGRSVMGCMVSKDDGWRMPDWLWERVEPLLPAPPFHPLGTHRSRVPDRDAMDAILLVLRTGMQWNALNATGVCSSSSAHRRFQEWGQAGVFAEIWRQGLLEYDKIVGIDWAWLAADGAMTKAPLGGPKTGPDPTDRAKGGRSVRFSARERGSRSGWRMTVPTATTRSC
jgi:transposase